ncbi:unnamed protein product [Didymodactylos carnosus]|uniref:Uncharacterized protein n=1 Tax=Didymodactylos carnosus TaxID=1234261 RepID=A0A815R4Q0_9BILA|nr:unnamed protein product [Didymodactylos carnosus]CAF1472144.1 unnamed protein product [Didymodactylos carnosus]CAF4105523.1 unnamed protein product [Didymodactylos carnosus]CAF4339473.1 unnamed protein product [Didymodactylos carnosus]
MPSIGKSYKNQRLPNDKIMRDFIDGEFSKQYSFFKESSKVKFILCEDGIEVSDLLQKKRRTLSLLYFTFGNLSRFEQSLDKLILMLAVCEKRD